MSAYTRFAQVYDLFMANEVPYDKWADFIAEAIRETDMSAHHFNTVLDLACGTGNMTLRLGARGFDMIGADTSHDMLAQAQAKAYEQNAQILWLAQDMRELDLYGTIAAVTCTCDAMNYLLADDEIKEVFRRVRLFLVAGGIFIFDMNTRFKFEAILGNGSFGDTAGNAHYQWDNHYDTATHVNTYRVTFQVGGEVFQELHRQRAYDPALITNWLLDAGFSSVALRDDYTKNPPSAHTRRVVFVCR